MTEAASEKRATGTAVAGTIIGAAAVLALILAAIEVTVRIEDWLRWGTPFTATATGLADLAVSDENGRHPRPNSRYRKWKFNSVGTRGPEPDSSGNTPRVLVLGASETLGLYERPEREYPRQLADSLGAAGCAADVLNAAFPGMSLPTVEQDLRLRLARLKPAVVVYYPTPPQYLDDAPPKAFRVAGSRRSTAAAPWWHPRFVMRFRDQVKLMVPETIQDLARNKMIERARAGREPGWLFVVVPPGRIAAFEADLRTLVGTIRLLGAEAVLATHVHRFMGAPPHDLSQLRSWERFYPRSTGTTLMNFDLAAATAVRRIAADSQVRLVDGWDRFARGQSEKLFADFSHFTDEGAALMASVLRPQVASALRCSP